MKRIAAGWFERIFNTKEKAKPRVEFVDPVLGKITNDPGFEGTRLESNLLARVPFEDRHIDLSIDLDGKTLEDCLELARAFFKSLSELNEKALIVASRDLLKEYNEDWRMFGICHEDGTTEEVENPALTPNEFETTIRLNSLSVTGAMVELWYLDMHLFAGHSIVVTAFDGLVFTHTNASIFG